MAIHGLASRDGIGLSLFVPNGRQQEAAAFYLVAFGATSPRHWIHPKTGEVTGIDITIGRASTLFQLCVDHVDATVALAVAAGATVRTPAQDADWGDRIATIVNPFGHIWALATIDREMSVDDYNARGNILLVEAA